MAIPSTKVSRLSGEAEHIAQPTRRASRQHTAGHRGAGPRRSSGDLPDRLRQGRRPTRHPRLHGLTVDARAGCGRPGRGLGNRVGRNSGGAQRIRVLVPLSQRRCLRGLRAGPRCRQGPVPGAADRLVHPGRTAELRASTRKELAATLPLRLPIGADNWSLKISDGWPEDPDEDIAGDAWAGVVPMSVAYGAPLPAPDLRPGIPVPESVRAMTGAPPSVQ